MFLFHSDARSFIGQYERGGSSPPFYIGLRTTRWLKFIGDKPNYTAGEKKRKEETPKVFFSPIDGTIRWNDDFNEKRGKKPLTFRFRSSFSKTLRRLEASYVRRLGFSIFQLLELGCTRTYAKLASKVGRIRRTNDRARSRVSTAIRATLVSPEKTLKLQLFLINDEMVIGVTTPPPRSIGIIS